LNKYELGIIIRATLDEESQNAELERVKGLITRFEGVVDKVDTWGRRKLAYPIEKQTDGIYHFIHFSSEGGTPAEVESRIRILENILRFMVIRMEDKPAKPTDSKEEEVPEVVAEVAE